jgi:protein TonB
MRFLEGVFFVSLAGAAHLGFWAGVPDMAGSTSAGSGGSQPMTVAAALPSHSALVAKWERPPAATATLVALTPPAVDAPGPMLPAPRESTKTPSLSKPADTAPPLLAQPQTDTEPQPITEPEPRAAQIRPQARPPVPDTAPRKEQVAAGSGAQAQQGQGGQTAVASAPSRQTKALMAQWGGAINAKIQRNMIYPAGSTAQGTAKLALTITPDGRLAGLSLQSSTGDATLDRAALHAAKRAGRFARAPMGLTDAQYRFAISLTFARN